MTRECHVRFCEGLTGRFRWSTRLEAGRPRPGSALDDYRSTHQSHAESPASADKLNRQKLVNALAINLAHATNHHHRTLGLLGEWGSGKTTVLQLLKDELKQNHATQPFIFGEFNAWSYEHTDSIQAGVAQEMISALTRLDEKYSFCRLCKRAWITIKFSWKTYPFQMIKISSLLGFSAIIYFEDWFNRSATHEVISGVGAIGLLLYSLREFSKLVLSPQAKELLTYLRLPSYAKHLGTIPVMRQHISTLCELRLKEKNGKTPRLLFVVDDLDRCSPEAIVKVLEAVRLVLDINNVIVVIAIDQHIALAALSKHFNDFSVHHKLKNSHAIAREYLSKVINLPIVLTAPSGDDVENFMHALWKDMPEEEAVKGANTSAQRDEKTDPSIGDAESVPNSASADGGSVSPLNASEPQSQNIQTTDETVKPVFALSRQQLSFIDWVRYFELNNPRQLKRLHNSYDLMRSVFDGCDKRPVDFNFPTENPKPVYPMLLTLIVMECLNSFEDLGARSHVWKKLFSPADYATADSQEYQPTPMTMQYKNVNNQDFIDAYRWLLKQPGYEAIAKNVEAFVLPAMVNVGGRPRPIKHTSHQR